MEQKGDAQMLTLKVMRLTKPQLVKTHPTPLEDEDMAADTLRTALARDVRSPDGCPSFGLGELALLPQSFGSIFLGETFTSYLSVHNDGSEVAKEVIIKAELQTGSLRATLTSTDAATARDLPPGESIDDTVQHEVKELGIHILVCSVHFVDPEGERKFFRKFFKFQVNKPLDIKTKAYNVQDCIFLEAQVQNITSNPMFLHSITLQPPSLFTAAALNDVEVQDGDSTKRVTTFGNTSYLNPSDTRQYLYRLSPEQKGGSSATRTATSAGKLDIIWRTSVGGQGRIQTSSLPRKPPPSVDLVVSAKQFPEEITCGNTFWYTCQLENNSSRPMKLQLREAPAEGKGLFLSGVARRNMDLQPHEIMELKLPLMPSSTGLLPLAGIALVDLAQEQNSPVYHLSHLPAVFANQSADS